MVADYYYLQNTVSNVAEVTEMNKIDLLSLSYSQANGEFN